MKKLFLKTGSRYGLCLLLFFLGHGMIYGQFAESKLKKLILEDVRVDKAKVNPSPALEQLVDQLEGMEKSYQQSNSKANLPRLNVLTPQTISGQQTVKSVNINV